MWRYNPDNPDEYIGNIWGWKFSAFGAVLLIGLFALALAVSHSRGIGFWDAVRESSPEQDTSLQHPLQRRR